MPSESETAARQKLQQKRREAFRLKWKNRVICWSWHAVLAEAFLLALWPAGAEAALLAGVLLTVLRFRTDKNFVFRHLPFDVPVCLFVLISGASVLASPDRGFSFYNWYNLVGVYLLTYFLIGQQVREMHHFRQILLALVLAAVLAIFYGFYQFLFGIDISAMKWVDGEAFPELRKRVFSTWENPNIFAGYLDILICLAFGFFVKAANHAQRIVLGVFMIAAAACLAMTYARGACLVFAVIFMLYGMLRDWRVLLACAVVGGALLLADPVLYERLASVFNKVDTSSEMRLAFWESTIAMIQDHPFLGIGWGAYWMVYPEYDFYLQGADIRIVHAHNLYLNYAAEIGIPGAAAFLWFFFGTMLMALRQKFLPPAGGQAAETPFDLKEDMAADAELKKVAQSMQAARQQVPSFGQECCSWPDFRLLGGLSLGLGLAVLSIALNGFTDDLLFNIPSSMLLWMMAALAAAAALRQEQEKTDD